MSDDPPDISVSVVNQQPLEIDEDRIGEVARRTATSEGASGEISILVIDRARSAELNQRFLGENEPTDVLSFPIDGRVIDRSVPDPILIGEIVVCPEVAATQGLPLEEELDLLVAHGVLHLLGHDHDTEEGAARMREKEKAITGHQGAQAS